MTAKEFMTRYYWATKELDRAVEVLSEFRLNKMLPSLIQDDMPHGNEVRDLSDYAVKAEILLDRIRRLQKKCIDTSEEIVSVIDQIDDYRQRVVLTDRYLLNKKWEDIAEDHHYSERAIYNIHGDALKAVEEIINGKGV